MTPPPELIERVANMLHDLMVPQPHPLLECRAANLYRELARDICTVVLEWAK